MRAGSIEDALRSGGVHPALARGIRIRIHGAAGWFSGLVATYGLRFAEKPRIMDLGLLARALKDRQIDFAGGNATDGLFRLWICSFSRMIATTFLRTRQCL